GVADRGSGHVGEQPGHGDERDGHEEVNAEPYGPAARSHGTPHGFSRRRLRTPGRIQLSVKRARIAHNRQPPATEERYLRRYRHNVLIITFPQVVTRN